MKLIAALGALFGLEASTLLERIRQSSMLYASIGAFALVGAVFLLIALHAWLALLWGPVFAPLAIGGAGIVIAALIWGVAALMRDRKVVREREKQRASEATALMTTAAVSALPLLMKSTALRKYGIPAAGAAAVLWFLFRDKDDDAGD